MRRRGPIAGALLVAAVVVIVLLVSGGGSGSNGYTVRAIFDNGAFMVSGEQVRVAGANVGTIESVSVSRPGETVAYRDGEPVAVPGKAIIVMNISDPSFQDFREDASCLIRPQSLIGEKFVDCRPTLPRAPGTQPPPSLKQIESGPGKGQYLLPLGSNGTSVDPDLINDIQTLPYSQRFRLILNELGAGLAGRGQDLEVLIKRANPVLRDVDTLFGELTEQKDQLAQLASDSEAILRPLSRERAQVAGFFANSGAAAQASSEKGPQLEESFEKFPHFLSEFRKTMVSLEGFSTAGTPVLEDLGAAAPSLTDATRTLTPFSKAATVALKSLGEAGEASGPVFAQTEPIVKKTAELAKSGVVPTSELAKLFVSVQKTHGWEGLTSLIYNTSAALNGFDQYGHFGRTRLALSNCTFYVAKKGAESGCSANFSGPNKGQVEPFNPIVLFRMLKRKEAEHSGGTSPEFSETGRVGEASATESEPALGEASSTGGTAPLLNYLLGQ